MDLTELQIQLRSIEDHISALQIEIEKMKPQPEDEKNAMFENVSKIAEQFPLNNKQFPEMTAAQKKDYITCLAYITLADKNKIYEKLLYLCRLSYGMGLSISSEEILRMGMEVDKSYFNMACSELKRWRYSFLTDSLILANITEEATDATFSVIADLAKIMGCDKKEDLRVVAYVAKAVLTDNMDILLQLPVPDENLWMGQFKQHIPLSWIRSQRIYCGNICTELRKKANTVSSSFGDTLSSTVSADSKKPYIIKNRLQSGTVVRKGAELIVYEKGDALIDYGKEPLPVGSFAAKLKDLYFLFGASSSTDEKQAEKNQNCIYAPCNGVAFFNEVEENDTAKNETRKCLYVYVISYFDDCTEFC